VAYRKAVLKRLDRARREYFRNEPASVAKAAEHLNLDPKNAHDREQLLYILAEAVFAPGKRGRKAGVRTYWHNVRLFNLGRLYSIEKEKSPRLKDAAIARRIIKHRDFKNDDPDQIRVRLPWAHQLFQERCEEALWDIAAEYVAEHGEPDEFDEPAEYDF
jgi:hypothetical protein